MTDGGVINLWVASGFPLSFLSEVRWFSEWLLWFSEWLLWFSDD
jgi:hypothetical protein